ncbi:hypothetical protein PHLCEN_2v2130 [Hermanssonia centrifuga]|uniref:NADH:flavin oxidoreductase/NADH oxidase N-terminal domain-containing protein n=1 Tax=Hermanssonia centrifuga TaxID=98765 RepID=A0A2R6RQ21_9APHY|nr:hypothetical protein PHLCEN_2v2130 [Hermanssonia centrifuga]
MSDSKHLQNIPAQNVPYFTPAQIPASGTAVPPSDVGGIVSRGPGLSFIEGTAVVPEGRITPEDLGIWSDEHIPAFAELTTFAHSQNQKIAIQLAHAGRKGSTVAPWLSLDQLATKAAGGWPDEVVGPSAIAHSDRFVTPKALTKEDICGIVQAFEDAARRSVQAGFDVIEIHGGHGYLLHSFMSPVSNQRTDEYGGSRENRTRIIVEVVDAVRKVVPKEMPVFYRISATEFLETTMPDTESWKVSDTIKLAPILADHGIDLLDVSSAGNHPLQSLGTVRFVEAYQADLSAEIKAAVGDRIIVGAVGGITNGKLAQRILDQNKADVIFVGRQFQKNPGTVWQFAEDLGVHIVGAHQIEWAFFGRGVGRVRPN